ncbi:MAG: serine protease [Acidiferrobacterales bacterium]
MSDSKGTGQKNYTYQGTESEQNARIRELIQEELRLAQNEKAGCSSQTPGGSEASSAPADGQPQPGGGPQPDAGNGGGNLYPGASTGTSSSTSSGAAGQGGSQGSSSGTGQNTPSATVGDGQSSLVALVAEYRDDRAKEQARLFERQRISATQPRVPVDGAALDPHQADSNIAPITDSKEFSPSMGKQPGNKTTGLEVMAVPGNNRARPESAQSAAKVQVPLPAYLASFGTAKDRHEERMRFSGYGGQTESSIMLEVIQGEDNRERINNTTEYPWRCICSLIITAADDSRWIGTGWLVSPRVVMTAGHCVHIANNGGWAKRIEVIPGRNATERPYGSAVSSVLRSVRGWTNDQNRDFDYGAILLPENNAYGRTLGWFGYASREDDYFDSLDLNLSGYPGDKRGPETGTQWFHSQEVRSVSDRQITYLIDTVGGQSGAPVWEMTSDGSRYGVGIHTWGQADFSNGATRITGGVFDNIVNWVSQAP